MKRFALTICLAACLVFLFGAVAMAQNTVVIQSKTVAMGGSASVGIAIANAAALKNIVIPLEIREIDAGSYITALTPQRTSGRLAIPMLGGVNLLQTYATPTGACKAGQPGGYPGAPSAPDFVSPDGVAFFVGKLFPSEPNLPPGSDPPSGSLELVISVTAVPGQFEIDTTCTNPANHLIFVADPTASIIPAFTKGIITIIPNACPTASAPSPVNVTIPNGATNQITASDPTVPPDVITYAMVPGSKGTVSSTGLWSYTPTDCDDWPGFDVSVYVSDAAHAQDGCVTVTFHVNVAATPLVTSNCGNVTVHWGDLASKTVGVSGGCDPYTFIEDSTDVDGNWTFQTSCPPPGSFAISIHVTDAVQQEAFCNFNLTVTNTAPTCTNPAGVTFPTGIPTSITLGLATDVDGDALTYNDTSVPPLPAWLSIVGNKLQGTRPVGDIEPYHACFTVFDGCETSAECCTDVQFETPRPPCIKIVGDPASNDCVDSTLNGQTNSVFVKVNDGVFGNILIGGFDLLIRYDRSGLTFMQAKKGTGIAGWEYFTFRTGLFGGNCGSGCPNGFIRLVGIADMNNGAHPVAGSWSLDEKILAELVFYVTADRTYIGSCFHVDFYSYDCGDNVFSDSTGNILYLPVTLQIPDGEPGWAIGCPRGVVFDEYYLTQACDTSHKQPAYRTINFCSGYICVRTPTDDRGDLNLNGVANEIADAVLYSNYFIYGSGVWDPTWKESQILSSDINADGLVLTIADLVYLIRIITGDAQPFPPEAGGPKLSPYANSVDVNSNVTDGALTVRTNSTVDLGGALFVYRYSGLTVGEPALTAGTNLTIKSRASNGELRILVYGVAKGAKVPAGLNNLITVPVSGNGTIELAESQVSDYNGALLTVNAAAKATPSTYALLQNYPNPFNAGTVIQFSLKDATNWNLSIYNIAGQIVRTFSGNGQGSVSVAWDGTSEGGSTIASGMYFYRLSTREFTATKKMVLMK